MSKLNKLSSSASATIEIALSKADDWVELAVHNTGGSVRVFSYKDSGTTFFVRLPLNSRLLLS